MWSGPHSENQLKIQSHFYRVHACFVKYFLMTEKLQQIRKLAYIVLSSLGPGGLVDYHFIYISGQVCEVGRRSC